MKRHEAPEKALQALFQIDVGHIPPVEALANVAGSSEADPFLRQLVLVGVYHQEEI